MEEPEPWYQLWQGAMTFRPFLQSFPFAWNSELLLGSFLEKVFLTFGVAWRFNFSDLAESISIREQLRLWLWLPLQT